MSNYYCQNCGEKSTALFAKRASDFRKNYKKIKDEEISVCQRCKDCFEKSEKSLQEILSLEDKSKLILGGPGTGKTFLFKNVIESLPEKTNILVITFIKNLAIDLKKQLSEISNRKVEVRTLHGFCKNFLLSKIHPYEYFPKSSRIIVDDASLLGFDFKEKEISRALVNLEKNNDGVKFYLSRSAYYNSTGHEDAVYRVFLYLDENNVAIPRYSQVIVDEYQDFNLLESSLVKLIGKKNQIMIAGDDDQALYRFRFASPDFIRKLYRAKQLETFFLSFCRRCTSILIEATSAFIPNAKGKGLLNERIMEKEFKCYWPDKFSDSKKYEKIFLGKCSADSIVSRHINEKILSIVEDENIQPSEKDEPEFLIIGPSRISHYLQRANETLLKDERINKDIFEIEFKKEFKEFSIDEGYKLIRKDRNSNLGWRVVMYKDRVDFSLEKYKEIIRESLKGKPIVELLPEKYITEHREKINNVSLEEDESPEISLDKKIKIKLTTYLGAKGLSANHVFVLGLENGIFPEDPNEISDDEACQFIVLLTRARKSLRILSVDKRFNKKLKRKVSSLSIFVHMIPERFFEINKITASNFNKL